jgi:DNA-binding LacI/PurR family transcriptional regulator
MELYAGLSEFAQLNNMKLELFYVSPSETSFDAPSYARIEPLRKREWDGAILIYSFPRKIVEEVDLKLPMVSTVEHYGAGSFNCVDVDHYTGISMVMDRLRALGHKRIGFYTRSYPVEAEWSFRRFAAYIEKLAREGFAPAREDVVNVYPGRLIPSCEESNRYVVERTRDGVTAWVCAADHQAYDLIAAVQKAGLRVPVDVSITGFDGIRKPDWAPLLTAAIIPFRELGYTSGRRLLEIMKKRFRSPQHILVAPRMREGETTGPAPGERLRGKYGVETY